MPDLINDPFKSRESSPSGGRKRKSEEMCPAGLEESKYPQWEGPECGQQEVRVTPTDSIRLNRDLNPTPARNQILPTRTRSGMDFSTEPQPDENLAWPSL